MVAQDHYFVLGRGFRYFVFSHLPEEDHPIWPAFSSKLGWFNHQLDPTSHLKYIFCYSKRLFQRNLRFLKVTLSNIPIGNLAALGVFFPFSPSFFVCQTQLRGNSQQPRCWKNLLDLGAGMGSESGVTKALMSGVVERLGCRLIWGGKNLGRVSPEN